MGLWQSSECQYIQIWLENASLCIQVYPWSELAELIVTLSRRLQGFRVNQQNSYYNHFDFTFLVRALRMVSWWYRSLNGSVITGIIKRWMRWWVTSGAGLVWSLYVWYLYIGIIIFFIFPPPLHQSPLDSVSLLSSGLIGQSNGGDAPLMSLPAVMTKPAGQYLDLTLL